MSTKGRKPTVQSLLETARRAIESARFPEARVLLDQIEKIDPGNQKAFELHWQLEDSQQQDLAEDPSELDLSPSTTRSQFETLRSQVRQLLDQHRISDARWALEQAQAVSEDPEFNRLSAWVHEAENRDERLRHHVAEVRALLADAQFEQAKSQLKELSPKEARHPAVLGLRRRMDEVLQTFAEEVGRDVEAPADSVDDVVSHPDAPLQTPSKESAAIAQEGSRHTDSEVPALSQSEVPLASVPAPTSSTVPESPPSNPEGPSLSFEAPPPVPETPPAAPEMPPPVPEAPPPILESPPPVLERPPLLSEAPLQHSQLSPPTQPTPTQTPRESPPNPPPVQQAGNDVPARSWKRPILLGLVLLSVATLGGLKYMQALDERKRPPKIDRVPFVFEEPQPLGCREGDSACDSDEQPTTLVALAPFQMAKYEVSQDLFARCVRAGKCSPHAGPNQEIPHLPMTHVTLAEAQEFCNWVEGRLPTEMEWESVARQGTLPEDDVAKTANHGSPVCCNEDDSDGWLEAGPVTEVGTNHKGISGMAGNVAEWTLSPYQRYADEPGVNGTQQVSPGGSPTESVVIRGGSFLHPPEMLRPTARQAMASDIRSKTIGFRCVWSSDVDGV